MKAIALIFSLLLWAVSAFAVSRVGGGSLSNVSEGLQSLTIPQRFQQRVDIFPDDSVTLHGLGTIGDGSMGFSMPQTVRIYFVRHEYPVLQGVTDRRLFDQYFLSRSWSQVPTSSPCLEVFNYSDPDGYNFVVGWGNGQGVLLAGPNTDDVRQSLQQILDSLILVPGACAWK